MGFPSFNRRDYLKASGATGLGMVAGCSAPIAGSPQVESPTVDVDRIAADPTDVPDPVDRDEPRELEIAMETTELTAEIEDGTTFEYPSTRMGRIGTSARPTRRSG